MVSAVQGREGTTGTHTLSGKARSKDSSYEIIERVLPWMAKLFFIYQKCNIFKSILSLEGFSKTIWPLLGVRLEHLSSTGRLSITY